MRVVRLFLSSVFVLLLILPALGRQLGGVTGFGGGMYIIDLESRQLVYVISHGGDVRGVQITPDNSLAIFAVVGGLTKELIFVDLESDPPRVIHNLDLGPFAANDTRITPDSRFALTIAVLASVDLRAREIVDGRASLFSTKLAITPDGRFAIFWDGSSGYINVVAIREDGTLEDTGQRIRESISGVTQMTITPNGRRLLATGGWISIYPFLHILDIAEDGTVTYLDSLPIVGQGEYLGLAVTPDGRKVYLTDYLRSHIRLLTIDAEDNIRDTFTRIWVPAGTPQMANGIAGLAMATTPTGTFAYLCSTISDLISIIDVATDTVLPEVIPLGFTPNGIAVQNWRSE